MARALGVKGILSGRILRHRENMLISVELVDARDKSQVWGAQYNRSGTEIDRYPAGCVPERMLFDGGHLWVTSQFGTTVSKLLASDGSSLCTFAPYHEPSGKNTALVFDGINTWVATRSGSICRL